MRERWRQRRESKPQRPAVPKPVPIHTPQASFLGWREIRTVLDAGTQVNGKLSFTTPARIDGRLRGEVRASDLLVVAAGASVHGTVWPTNLIVAGEVRGQILGGERVEIQSGGRVVGTIECKTLVIVEGATFEGDCRMRDESTVALDAPVHG